LLPLLANLPCRQHFRQRLAGPVPSVWHSALRDASLGTVTAVGTPGTAPACTPPPACPPAVGHWGDCGVRAGQGAGLQAELYRATASQCALPTGGVWGERGLYGAAPRSQPVVAADNVQGQGAFLQSWRVSSGPFRFVCTLAFCNGALLSPLPRLPSLPLLAFPSLLS
jgi:hypothetical protein